MTLYQKIPGPFIRDPKTNKLTEEFTSTELKALATLPIFRYTEKVDGTSVRIVYDGHRVSFAGRTDNAQLPAPLLAWLTVRFGTPEAETLFEQKFGETPVTLYGEGYGPKIQNGGTYRSDVSFVLFDVMIDGMYLLWDSVKDISEYFSLDLVPFVATGTIQDGINIVSKGIQSQWNSDLRAEGLVGVTTPGLLDRRGNRIIVKIKSRDFYIGE